MGCLLEMDDTDATHRLLLLSDDPAPARKREAERRAALEAARAAEHGDEEVFRIWAEMDWPESHREVVAVFGPDPITAPGPQRVRLRRGDRTSRLDTIPWRAGHWFLRAEVLDANGRWRTTNEVRLDSRKPGAGSDHDARLRELERIARSDAEPARRLLAALEARRLDESRGFALLRALAEGDDVPEPLAEAAGRQLPE